MANSEAQEINLQNQIQALTRASRQAWFSLANLSSDKRNGILETLVETLKAQKEMIQKANQVDIENAKKNNLSPSLIDRLLINDSRFEGILTSLSQIIEQSDPLGKTLEKLTRPNGLEINKITVPIGVLCLIFESRPNVTVEAGALAIKSGNAIILKGGKEAFYSNQAFASCFRQTFEQHSLPEHIVSLVPFKEREATGYLLKEDQNIDLVIPRGGEGLIRFVTENSLIPVLKHYKGLCHTYIDSEANRHMATQITVNAKCQRPGVCNAMETLLIHDEISHDLLPPLSKELLKHGVELRGCEKSCHLIPECSPASEEDWSTEYLEKILSIKVVNDIDEAIDHIEKYGSRHSEAIITEDLQKAAHFIQNIDASAVFVNASTRFNDGFEFGRGAEMGISTDKLHARGPMGIQEMTTYKYVVKGNGNIRE